MISGTSSHHQAFAKVDDVKYVGEGRGDFDVVKEPSGRRSVDTSVYQEQLKGSSPCYSVSCPC